MSPRPPPGARLTFGDFVLDTEAAQLLRHDSAIELRPKSFEVLCLLAQNAERVLSRDQLAALWHGRVATDESIAQCISDIRRALSDPDQRLLQTVPRRGYALKVPVRQAPATPLAFSQAAERATPAATDRPTLVVLPFVNNSEGARLDMLARGFTEDVTAGLARYAQLFVIGRESAVAFGEGARDARSVGQAAGVRFVVQGSLRWNAGQLRVAAKLVQAEGEAVIWADHFDGADDQLFAFQDEIVARIVAALVESVDRQSHRRSRRHSGTDSLSAYELFLQGRELRRTILPANFPQAEALLERATALDPDFAPAYGELAWLQYYYIGTGTGIHDGAVHLERGLQMARRAYELAPELPLVSMVLGNLHMRVRDFAEAERWSRRAIRLGPGDAENYAGLANVLSFLADRSEEAVELMHMANRFNPIRPPLHDFYLARALAWSGRFEQALPIAQSCLSRAPGFWPCAQVLVVALAHLGRTAEAAAGLSDWQSQCGIDAPRLHLERHVKLPGPEFDRMREGLRLAGLAEG
jgi:TolB-like protein